MDRTIELAPSAAPAWSGPPGISFTPTFAERLLVEFTEPGDVVVDPFVGYGTTMVVADRIGRRGIGVELLAERVGHVRSLVARPADVHVADARDLKTLGLPRCDASLSSPPYMTRSAHPEDPLDGYRTHFVGDGGYERHVRDLAAIYAAVGELVVPGGPVLIDVATLAVDGEVTDLAGDLAAAIRSLDGSLTLEEAIEVVGEEPASWMVADVVLVCRVGPRAA
jgi:hypothetical protein